MIQENINQVNETISIELQEKDEQLNEIINRMYEEDNEENKKIKIVFKNIGLPAFLVAGFLTFCLFRNYSGITMIFAVMALAGYVFYATKKLNKKWKVGSVLCVAVMGLLAISDFITADSEIIFYNNIGIFLMFFVLVVCTFMDGCDWNFKKSLYTFTEMFFEVLDGGFLFLADCKLAKVYKHKSVPKNVIYIIVGLIIAMPMLLVTGVLLSSADKMFADLFNSILGSFEFMFDGNLDAGTMFAIAVSFCIYVAILYGTMRYVNVKVEYKEVNEGKKLEALIAITVLVPMAFMYVVFSIMQIVFLFGGAIPDSYDYASYARTGFFQLLAVCIINLIMVLIVQNLFKEHKVEKILLTVVSVCTYVMLASSAYRMILYVEAYNLTRLRVKVLWALALIAILLVGVIIKIFSDKFKLFRYVVIVVSILYLGLSFSHMDYFIAKYNQYASEEYGVELDYEYLNELSADAASVIIEFDNQELFNAYFRNIKNDGNVSVRSFNVSKYNSKRYVDIHKEVVAR